MIDGPGFLDVSLKAKIFPVYTRSAQLHERKLRFTAIEHVNIMMRHANSVGDA